MNYELLDDDEVLSLSLSALNNTRDEDAIVLLRVLVARNPSHVMGRYLLAAQHAQLGLFERAEQEFRQAVDLAPAFAMARLQFAQLLLVKGDAAAAVEQFNLIGTEDQAVRAYADGLAAIAEDRTGDAMSALHYGLSLPQSVPALAGDMQRLIEQLGAQQLAGHTESELTSSIGATMLLSNYSRYN